MRLVKGDGNAPGEGSEWLPGLTSRCKGGGARIGSLEAEWGLSDSLGDWRGGAGRCVRGGG